MCPDGSARAFEIRRPRQRISEVARQPAAPAHLCMVIDGERSVGDIADALNVRQSAVSQHLALLRKDGLVARAATGRRFTTVSPTVT